MIFGSLICGLYFAVVVTASSFWNVTPTPENDIRVTEDLGEVKEGINYLLMARHPHGKFMISNNTMTGNAIINCSNNCVASVEFKDGSRIYANAKHVGIHSKIDINRTKNVVHVMFGDGTADNESLEAEISRFQNNPLYKPRYTLYTVLLRLDQESEEAMSESEESEKDIIEVS